MLQLCQCNLTEEQAQKLIDFAVEFHAAFALDDGERGEAKGVEHVIDTADSQPIRQIPQRVPFALREEISRMVQEMGKWSKSQRVHRPGQWSLSEERWGTTLLRIL